MGATVIGGTSSSSAPDPAFIPSAAVPIGLTLRQTYTSTTSGLSWPVTWLYVVAVGGGGGGATNASNTGGGGGGACIQGWVKASDVTSVTIGAGGASTTTASGNRGGDTLVGPIVAHGGGPGAQLVTVGRPNGPGAAWGGVGQAINSAADTPLRQFQTISIYAGLFTGGSGLGNAEVATSGAGGTGIAGGSGTGGIGYQGPGGGGFNGADGGSSRSPNGTTYTGGVANSGASGGGAGILANGGNAPNTTAAGNGGSGGGGGGGHNTSSTQSGAGGNGAVLIYY